MRLKTVACVGVLVLLSSCSWMRSTMISGIGPALVTAPGPSGIQASDQYAVQLSQGPDSASSFVYKIPNLSSTSSVELDTSWSTFSYSGSVTVTVTQLQGTFASARVLPSSANLPVTISGNSISFTLSGQTGQYAIDFCATGSPCTDSNDPTPLHPMLIFANPLETDAPSVNASNVLSVTPGTASAPGNQIPTLNSNQNVLYFGPGVYDLSLTPYTLGSGQTTYLAAGSYVRGALAAAAGATNWKISGTGILSGENFNKSQCTQAANLCARMVSSAAGSSNGLVQGITIVQSAWYNILLSGTNNIVNNVKVMSWQGNTDGVSVGSAANDPGGQVLNSFFKVGDDAIKLLSSNLTVSGCTLWQLENAASFEMGANGNASLSNISVTNSNVVRTEYNFPNRDNAVIAGDYGGQGNRSGYSFSNMNIENSSWQVFKLAVIPNASSNANAQLGSLSNISFSNINVTSPQSIPSLFQGFNTQHQISNLSFENVRIAGQLVQTPTPSFDANRSLSLNGTAAYNPVLENGSQFQIWTVNPALSSTPQYTSTSVSTSLSSNFTFKGLGDFYGDGYASVLFLNTTTTTLSIAKDPGNTSLGAPAISTVTQGTSNYVLGSGDRVAGIGDFNGDGYSDILIWNLSSQTGTVLLMNGSQVQSTVGVSSATSAVTWDVVGVADFDQSGYSDILFRNTRLDTALTTLNLEILFFYANPASPVGMDFTNSQLKYTSTANFNSLFGAVTGSFDNTWEVAGVADLTGNGYPNILWRNSLNSNLGMTSFWPVLQSTGKYKFESNTVFDQLSPNQVIKAIGDMNVDGAADLLLLDISTGQATSGQVSVLYMGFFGGDDYEEGPVLSSSLPSGFNFQF